MIVFNWLRTISKMAQLWSIENINRRLTNQHTDILYVIGKRKKLYCITSLHIFIKNLSVDIYSLVLYIFE